jgi:hypothetical protein
MNSIKMKFKTPENEIINTHYNRDNDALIISYELGSNLKDCSKKKDFVLNVTGLQELFLHAFIFMDGVCRNSYNGGTYACRDLFGGNDDIFKHLPALKNSEMIEIELQFKQPYKVSQIVRNMRRFFNESGKEYGLTLSSFDSTIQLDLTSNEELCSKFFIKIDSCQ